MSSTPHNTPAAPVQVLVVDDDVVSRMMLMHLVDTCGRFEILEAEDGADAWRQLEGGLRPALVFCDLRMPHLSGTDLLVRVKAHPQLAGMPFVLVSAANDGATMSEAAALGADGYVVKPFRVESLRPWLTALSPAEAPRDSARRLGIDLARLALYLGGLARQLDEAAAGLDAQLRDTPSARARLARLQEGCATLGLHTAAARLAQAGEALVQADAQEKMAAQVAAALAEARGAVKRQTAWLEAG